MEFIDFFSLNRPFFYHEILNVLVAETVKNSASGIENVTCPADVLTFCASEREVFFIVVPSGTASVILTAEDASSLLSSSPYTAATTSIYSDADSCSPVNTGAISKSR